MTGIGWIGAAPVVASVGDSSRPVDVLDEPTITDDGHALWVSASLCADGASELTNTDGEGSSDPQTIADDVRAVSLSRAIDALAVAVDRLFVTELQRGLADEDTVELVATSLDLAAAARAARSTDGGDVTCSG